MTAELFRPVELMYAAVLFVWIVLLVTLLTKKTYEAMRSKGLTHNVAIYYNRKIIHVGAGGVVALLAPYLFQTPFVPFVFAMILAVFTYLPHRTGKLLYWFQDPENIYEVHFCITWGLSLLLSWLLFGTLIYAVVPTAFMSFGDSVTGVVRNMIYRRRTKAWAGNAAMAAVCIPIGYVYAGLWGALAGLASSVIEHFELRPLDDNITVPLVSLAILALANAFGSL
ncbi:MAG: dolichol kinase [Thermofilaceae archaeon]